MISKEDFWKTGYTTIPSVLTPEEIQTSVLAVDSLVQAAGLAAKEVVFLKEGVLQHPDLATIAHHPVVWGAVWSLLEVEFEIYHAHLAVNNPCKVPRKPGPWHQDYGRPGQKTVKVGFYLTDTSEIGRGNTYVFPGVSRHMPNDLDVPVPICMPPGSVLIYDTDLWHGRSSNPTPIPRRAVFFSYRCV